MHYNSFSVPHQPGFSGVAPFLTETTEGVPDQSSHPTRMIGAAYHTTRNEHSPSGCARWYAALSFWGELWD